MEKLFKLKENGTTNQCLDKMMNFPDFNKFIGLEDYNNLDKKYK